MPYGLFVPMPCGAAAGYLDPDQGKIDLPSAYCSCVNPRSGRFSYGQLKAPRAPRRVTRGFFLLPIPRPDPRSRVHFHGRALIGGG
jgi:hypothetical protein